MAKKSPTGKSPRLPRSKLGDKSDGILACSSWIMSTHDARIPMLHFERSWCILDTLGASRVKKTIMHHAYSWCIMSTHEPVSQSASQPGSQDSEQPASRQVASQPTKSAGQRASQRSRTNQMFMCTCTEGAPAVSLEYLWEFNLLRHLSCCDFNRNLIQVYGYICDGREWGVVTL